MRSESYELILKGSLDDSLATRARLAQILNSECGFRIVEIDEVLSRGPISVCRAAQREDLVERYDLLKQAGAEVQIVHRREGERRLVQDRFQTKVKTLEQLRHVLARARERGKSVVHCHGVFDLIHLGHMRHLNSAKRFGDLLIVTLTADRFVNKGPGRPVFTQAMRAEMLANLAAVDFVCVSEYPTAVEVINAVRPDYYVKGPDYKDRDKDVTGKIHEEEAAVQSVGGEIVFTDDATWSSSQLLNLYFDPLPQTTVQYLRKIVSKYTIEDLARFLDPIRDMKVLVIGDAIVDEYHYCSALGKSAKENIVVNKFSSDEYFAGGSLATANHAAQLSRKVDLATVLGERASFEDFIRSHLNETITPQLFYRPNCVTTTKRRFVSVDANQKLFEICNIDDAPLSRAEEQPIYEFLDKHLRSYDLVIVSDFGHGMMTERLMKLICKKAKCLALNVQTNGANQGFNLVTKYQRADLVCIDERELRLATGDRFTDSSELVKQVYDSLQCKMIVATRGHHGSVSYTREQGIMSSPALAYQSVDKVGAGDAFFAYTAPCFAAGVPHDLIGFIGNAVGALKVQIVGNRSPVTYVDLMKFVTRLFKV